MKRKARFKIGGRFGQWTLERYVDSGGNGEVWEAQSDGGVAGAIKILHTFGGDHYKRFKREVEIAKSLDDNEYAILPLLDSHVPGKPSKDNPPWLVMPYATLLPEALADAPLIEKVDAGRQIAATLGRLSGPPHELHHRDIKPQNLYQHGGRFCVGDFGLAIRPSDPDMTAEGQIVGPFKLLPSEVFMKGADPDWERVDVHCLALTLWLLATGEEHPPRGAIAAGGEYSLSRWLEHDYLSQLDGVLASATNETPSNRPSMKRFERALDDWLHGFSVRQGIRREAERGRAIRDAVLRDLAAFVRSPSPSFSFGYDVDREAETDIQGATEGDVSDAIAELVERGLLYAEPEPSDSRPIRWIGIYPTLYGMETVDGRDVLEARAAPLVRALLEPQDLVSFDAGEAEADVGGVKLPPQEAWYLLSYLEGRGLVSFRQHREGGSGILLTDVKTTSYGLDWLAERYE